ncbi:MAG: hypothetical protein KJ622_10490 [Alphaproteobacteria bacterium]|nr:hypothetical protein [Alphaproteobacteria bacterium]
MDRARVQLIDVENSTDEVFDGIEHQFKAVKKRLDKQTIEKAECTVVTADGEAA